MDYSKASITYCAKDILHCAWSSKFIIIIIIKMTLRFQGHPSTHALYTREKSSERLSMSLINTASGRSCPKDARRAGWAVSKRASTLTASLLFLQTHSSYLTSIYCPLGTSYGPYPGLGKSGLPSSFQPNFCARIVRALHPFVGSSIP
jgi:hypothetical protein